MKTWGTALLLLSALPALAQQKTAHADLTSNQLGAVNLRDLDRLGNLTTGLTFDRRYSETRGTPYTAAAWLPASLLLRSGQRVADVQLKYDAYGARLLALRTNKDSVQLDLNMVDRFVLRQHVVDAEGRGREQERWYQRLEGLPAVNDNTFVEVLLPPAATGYALYKLPRKHFVPAKTKQSFGTGIDYNRFVDASEFYLRAADGSVQKIDKLSARSLEEVLNATDAARLRALKLRIGTEAELKNAVMVLNQPNTP
ncbi:hypothetical protein [Hymenobacter sp. B81]|uniref:hypothetical protein n=1 Tax=Hymenobacter sp. B81 TaxID=3344878 RepID=UPI0037DC8494